MKYRLLVLIFPLFFPVLAWANGGKITGKITLGTENLTLPGATVWLKETTYQTTTNRQGEFTLIDIPPGTYTLQASYTGYQTQYLENITVHAGNTSFHELHLPELVFDMDEVVVTGSLITHLLKDTPVITEVISNQSIKDVGSSNLVDIMREQTGLEISYGIGRTQSAQLNGLNDNHVLVLVDGERITGRVDGAVDLGQIPVHQIERIEVVKGPISSIYGSEAMGGVINIITKDAERAPLFTSQITFGSYGRQDYIFSAAKTIRHLGDSNRSLKLYASGGYNKQYEIDYDTQDNFHELPEQDRRNFNLKLDYDHGRRVNVSLKADVYQDESMWLEGGSDVVWRDIATNDKISLLGSYTHRFTPTTVLKLSGNYSFNEHGFEEFTPSGYQVKDNVNEETFQNYKAQLTFAPYRVTLLTVGVEQIIEAVASDRLVDENGEPSETGDLVERDYSTRVIYAEQEWSYANHTFAVGGRYSDNSDYGTFFAPKVSLMYRLRENLRLRASYGRGFRQPSIKELYIDYDNSNVGYKVEGAPGLKPEKSNGYNLGIEYFADSRLWFRTNFFYNDLEDLIEYYTKSSEGERAVLSYYNIDNATISGINLDANYKLFFTNFPFETLDLNLGYAYTKAEDGNGNELAFRVPHSLNWKAVLQSVEWGLRGNFRGRWYDEKRVYDEQTNVDIYAEDEAVQYNSVPAHVILDAKMEKDLLSIPSTWGTLAVELYGGINNITDEKHFPFGQIKGRDIYAGIHLIFQ
ncbi:MAG: TonB-dependent receptor [Gemmatimonadetes bacterium]|nr:MAG: TonB-dependent receptor [Gemmatimonadota bacterium]